MYVYICMYVDASTEEVVQNRVTDAHAHVLYVLLAATFFSLSREFTLLHLPTTFAILPTVLKKNHHTVFLQSSENLGPLRLLGFCDSSCKSSPCVNGILSLA